MFRNMKYVKSGKHNAGDCNFFLDVYRVLETGDLECFISKEGDGLEIISMASSRAFDSKQMGDDPAEWLIRAASDEIDLNSDSQYF
jgi:hypothetical protein